MHSHFPFQDLTQCSLQDGDRLPQDPFIAHLPSRLGSSLLLSLYILSTFTALRLPVECLPFFVFTFPSRGFLFGSRRNH